MMNKKPLVHFVEWKKVNDAELTPTLEALHSWGVRRIVAHPVWGIRERQHPGYLDFIDRQIRAAGLETSACHAFWGEEYDISNKNADILRKSLENHAAFLRRLAGMGVKTYTMHIGMEDSGGTPWKIIGGALDVLLPVAEETGIALALENGHENLETQRELAGFIHSRSHPLLGICFDIGHANCYGDKNWQASMKIFEDVMLTCHLHDNYGNADDHNPPGSGNVDWRMAEKTLKKMPRLLHAETESGDWSRDSWNRFDRIWEENVSTACSPVSGNSGKSECFCK